MPETRLVERLLATSAVTDIVGTRIRPIQLTQKTDALPALTYQTIDIDPENGSTGLADVAFARIQVDSLAPTYSGMKTLGAAIRTALNGWQSSTASPAVGPVHWMGDTDLGAETEPGQDKPTYTLSSDFLLQYNV